MGFGFLGIAFCVAGIAGAWYVGSRAGRASDIVFERIDKSLEGVRDRVLNAQRRVQESKITTEEVGQTVKDWARKETGERLASRLQIEEKATRLVRGLEQADQWMELSGASMQRLKQALELASSIGAPVDAAFLEPLLAKLESLRGQLKQVSGTVDGFRDRTTELVSGELVEERLNEVVQLALRVVSTFGEVDARLGEFAGRLSEAKSRGEQMKIGTHRAILTAEAVVALVMIWMAAGQTCLFLRGWRDRPTSPAAAQLS